MRSNWIGTPNATSYFPTVVSSNPHVMNTCKSNQPHTSLSPTVPVNRSKASTKQPHAEPSFSVTVDRSQGSTRGNSKGGKKRGKQGSFSGSLSVKEKQKVHAEGQVGKQKLTGGREGGFSNKERKYASRTNLSRGILAEVVEQPCRMPWLP
jgi:hypothetical protein